ncbi:MAG: hypothetical protein IT379_39350 [Deltaproteobacteria bacterium]|nr:hypothetical protein [Deltaproteobacteria bacterium]
MTWNDIVSEWVIPSLVTIAGGALTALLALAVRYLERRLRIDIPERTERALDGVAQDAVAYAEQLGRKAVREARPRPVGNALLEASLEYAQAEIRRRRLPELGRDELVRLIESRLGHENALRPSPTSNGASERTTPVPTGGES